MEDRLKYAAQLDRDLRRAYEDQKFGTSRRRIHLEEMYQPLVSLLDRNKREQQQQQRKDQENALVRWDGVRVKLCLLICELSYFLFSQPHLPLAPHHSVRLRPIQSYLCREGPIR